MALIEAPDTFAAAIALIGPAVDPKACAKRIEDLQKQVEALAKAQAKLEADRSSKLSRAHPSLAAPAAARC
jgi:hypothetical protein